MKLKCSFLNDASPSDFKLLLEAVLKVNESTWSKVFSKPWMADCLYWAINHLFSEGTKQAQGCLLPLHAALAYPLGFASLWRTACVLALAVSVAEEPFPGQLHYLTKVKIKWLRDIWFS